MPWLEDFRRETAPIITDPFLLCLAEAIATVESAHGRAIIFSPPSGTSPQAATALNEIGYKAIPNHPSTPHATAEADPKNGDLIPTEADFRLFANRAEQATALLYLFQSSAYFESARLFFILAFYAAYAPGRTAGTRAVVEVFNQIAASNAHPGIRPFALAESLMSPDSPPIDKETRALNHAAARQAVRTFIEFTVGKAA